MGNRDIKEIKGEAKSQAFNFLNSKYIPYTYFYGRYSISLSFNTAFAVYIYAFLCSKVIYK